MVFTLRLPFLLMTWRTRAFLAALERRSGTSSLLKSCRGAEGIDASHGTTCGAFVETGRQAEGVYFLPFPLLLARPTRHSRFDLAALVLHDGQLARGCGVDHLPLDVVVDLGRESLRSVECLIWTATRPVRLGPLRTSSPIVEPPGIDNIRSQALLITITLSRRPTYLLGRPLANMLHTLGGDIPPPLGHLSPLLTTTRRSLCLEALSNSLGHVYRRVEWQT